MPHHRRLPPSGPPNRPLKARTPARPDGANLKPPAPAAGGFTLGPQFQLGGGAPPPAGGFTLGGQFSARRRARNQARFAARGYTTVGSVSTFTTAGRPAENARSSAGRSS